MCNLANTASLLWHGLHSIENSPLQSVNWAGFYVLRPGDQSILILGPFQGKVACQTIAVGRGVCGAAAAEKKTQLVSDVDKFPGHIACDSETKSEIVVPIVKKGPRGEAIVIGVLDIDCTKVNAFDQTDKEMLQELALFLGDACDWGV